MAKLNQIIAIEKGIKAHAHSEISTLYKIVQKPELFAGFSKKYNPIDETGEQLPPEEKRVTHSADNLLLQVSKTLSELFEVTARKDWLNTKARADVNVDGRAILNDVPVTYLLFLEKQLTDLRTFIAALPVLDSSEDWHLDDVSGLHKTEQTQTHRTKKVARPIVLYQATPEHPAQTQLITEDIIAGHWVLVKRSGAASPVYRAQVLARVEKLLQGIKQAREEANGLDETEEAPSPAGRIFSYLLD